MDKPRDRHFLEAFLQNAEAYADSVTDNEAVKAVPVIGTAIKICKGLDDARSRALMAKLAGFIGDPSLRKSRDWQETQDRLIDNPKEQRRIGETLFLVIDKVTDLEKPPLLAKVFSAYLDGIITASILLRLAHAIDIAYIDDLNRLLEDGPDQLTGLDTLWRQTLIGAGMARPNTGVPGHVDYDLTSLAHEFHKAVTHAMQQSKI